MVVLDVGKLPDHHVSLQTAGSLLQPRQASLGALWGLRTYFIKYGNKKMIIFRFVVGVNICSRI